MNKQNVYDMQYTDPKKWHICVVPQTAVVKDYSGVGWRGDMVTCMGVDFTCLLCNHKQWRRINDE